MEHGSPDIDWALVERSLTVDLDADDRRRAERLWQAHPRLRAMCDEVERQLDPFTGAERVAVAEEAFDRLRDRLALGSGANGAKDGSMDRARFVDRKSGRETGRRITQPRRWIVAWPMLGAAVGILLLGWSAGLHRLGIRARPVSYLTYTTARGQRANITLPDGNTVVLNVASQLDVPSNYASGNHALRLSGEALFNVTRHDDMPFTVTAAGEMARVLGTSFVMRHYPGDTSATIAVRDGKVGIRTAVLGAQQMTEIVRGRVSVVRHVSSARFGFATGTLSISGMTLADAVPELGRWYDVDLRLGDPSLGTRYVEGEFVAGAPSDLASILELALHIRIVRDGRTLTLFPR